MQVKPFFPVVHPTGAQPVRLWVFPGQGSQKVGMGKELYDSSPSYRRVFDQGHAALEGEGVDLRKLVFEGPSAELTRTLHAQPALLVSNLAFLEHLRSEAGVGPQSGDLVAGHSLGEWAAYAAAGSLTIEQATLSVYWRGRFMEEAFPYDPSAAPMAAVLDLPEDVVVSICGGISREGHVVVAANLNTPNQIVISGHPAAIKEAAQALKQAGASKVVELKVAGPFHSALMAPVQERLKRKLQELSIVFRPTQNTVIANVTARPMAPDADHLASLLLQITGSVLWTASMRRAWELGALQMVNVDVAGSTLLGMAKQIFSRDVPVQSVDPTIPMHIRALRFPVGAIRTTVFPSSTEVKTRRVLEFSYDAGAIVEELKKLIEAGDFQTAALVLANPYNISREAAMRILQQYADHEEVAEAMRNHGFVNPDGSFTWPSPELRDLPVNALPAAIEQSLRTEIFPKLSKQKLAPIDPDALVYYVASRWDGNEERLNQMLSGVNSLDWLSRAASLKLALTKFKDANGEEQKGIDSWDKVALLLDGVVGFKYPGAMTQGDCV